MTLFPQGDKGLRPGGLKVLRISAGKRGLFFALESTEFYR